MADVSDKQKADASEKKEKKVKRERKAKKKVDDDDSDSGKKSSKADSKKANTTTDAEVLGLMTVERLRALASARGVNLPGKPKKSDWVALLSGGTPSAQALTAPPRASAGRKRARKEDDDDDDDDDKDDADDDDGGDADDDDDDGPKKRKKRRASSKKTGGSSKKSEGKSKAKSTRSSSKKKRKSKKKDDDDDDDSDGGGAAGAADDDDDGGSTAGTDKSKYDSVHAEVSKLGVDALKREAELNNQKKTGNKGELVDRITDGRMYGAIPRCSSCGGGLPCPTYLPSKASKGVGKKYGHNGQAGYVCPGFYDDDHYRSCRARTDSIQRDPWQIPPAT